VGGGGGACRPNVGNKHGLLHSTSIPVLLVTKFNGQILGVQPPNSSLTSFFYGSGAETAVISVS